MSIIKNPTWTDEEHIEFANIIKSNGGYCPCSLIKNEDTKCMCKEFREQESGECHCGRFVKKWYNLFQQATWFKTRKRNSPIYDHAL